MIRYITLAELSDETFHAEQIECHRQIWEDGTKWRRYLKYPRFSNGLSFICSNITVDYVLPDGTRISAGQGDAVSVGHESHYGVYFHNGGQDTDLYTVNFLLRDMQGNELRLTQGVQIYKAAATPDCLSAVSELYEACLFSESQLKKQAILLRLLDALSSFLQRHSEEFHPIRRGASLLMKEWNQNRKIGYYAQVCGISERNFYNLFKNWAGKTPVDYRNEMRTTAAASLLVSTNLSIGEIAFKTGFEDPYYFSRVFKKNMGVSPKVYRKGNGSFPG